MFEQLTQTIESHPVISSVLVGGVGIIVTIYFVQKYQGNSSGQNAITGVPTDAAGNNLSGGLSVSPPLSNSDLSTMLQDMEQQILNWEQQFSNTHPTTGNTNGSGNNPPPPPAHNPPPGNNPPPVAVPWWKSILTTNPNRNLPNYATQSWYKVPTAMTENAIASFFGEAWPNLAYNLNNKSLFNGSFLADSYNRKGNNIIPAGTFLWIPTTGIKP